MDKLRQTILETIDSAIYTCDRITPANVSHNIVSIKQLLLYYKKIAEENETALVD